MNNAAITRTATARLAIRTGLAAGLAGASLLFLSACGHSNKASDPVSADNVEMPAEEAMSGVTATPAADPSATATDSSGSGSSGTDSSGADSSTMVSSATDSSSTVPNSTGH